MARVRPRTAAVILGLTLLASVGVAYGWSKANGNSDVVDIGPPGTFAESSGGIPTAPKLAGATLPATTLRDLQGNSVETASLLGSPLVINIWLSTCEPCKKEIPDFATVQGELGDRVRFVGLNYAETAAVAQRFADKYGARYELLLDPDGNFTNSLKIGNFPATLLVSPDGRIVSLHQGAYDAASLRKAITEQLLA